jgi:superoxide dismutase, Fe-Mn family
MKMQRRKKMQFTLPELPYDKAALEPYISANTLSFHYDKHHRTYVTNLNKLLEGRVFKDKTIVGIIGEANRSKDPISADIFNNAGQVWNHTFYWHCMKPKGGGEPSAAFKARIEKTFGTWEQFLAAFKRVAAAQFGSGWVWLIEEGMHDRLEIIKLPNGETPMTYHLCRPLLTCDVWEHAYYLDYQNRRVDYVDIFLNHLVNWEFVESRLQARYELPGFESSPHGLPF